MARVAVKEQEDFVKMGTTHGVLYEYSPKRTAEGFGNRFFRLSGVVELPPALYVAALLHPTEVGSCDATLRLNRVLHDFDDGKTRLYHLIAEAGPRPLFCDRDDCTLTSYQSVFDNFTLFFPCGKVHKRYSPLCMMTLRDVGLILMAHGGNFQLPLLSTSSRSTAGLSAYGPCIG